MENRTNNKTTNKASNQTTSKTTNRSRTAARTTNSTGEHKHPNQYTKGADDEGAKNAKTTDSKAAKGSKNCR